MKDGKLYFKKKDSGIFPDFLTELTLLYIRHEKMFFSAGIPNQRKSQTEKKEKSFFNFLRHYRQFVYSMNDETERVITL